MPSDMTPDEIAFFETGELPEALASQLNQPNIDAPAAPETTPVVVPAPAEGQPAVQPVVAASEDTTSALLERMLQEERERRSALETKFAALEAKLTEKAAPTPEVGPDETDDPLGAMFHKLDKMNSTVLELQNRLTQEQEQNLRKQQFDTFIAGVAAQKTAFEATTPDFKEAYAFVRNLRTEDLRLAGAPEADIPKILLNDELQIAQAAMTRGKNPAEEMYNMAKRYGYAAKATPAASATKATPIPVASRIAQLKAGQEAATQPGKAASESELTLDSVKDMSNANLNKLVADDKMWAQIIGGTSYSPDIF